MELLAVVADDDIGHPLGRPAVLQSQAPEVLRPESMHQATLDRRRAGMVEREVGAHDHSRRAAHRHGEPGPPEQATGLFVDQEDILFSTIIKLPFVLFFLVDQLNFMLI
mgnify:CR=1 FL=1